MENKLDYSLGVDVEGFEDILAGISDDGAKLVNALYKNTLTEFDPKQKCYLQGQVWWNPESSLIIEQDEQDRTFSMMVKIAKKIVRAYNKGIVVGFPCKLKVLALPDNRKLLILAVITNLEDHTPEKLNEIINK